jgi:hypothetical protein
MSWLEAFRLRRAAIAYARKLPNHLARAYGRGRTYTPGQIRTAVDALKLDPQFVALALAAYLEDCNYQDLRDGLPMTLDYNHARATFLRYLPGRPVSASASAEDGSWGPYSDASGGDHGGHGGGHH